jgi:hypothetical protein
VARGADFDVNIRLVGSGVKGVAARTRDGAGYIIGMDVFLHGSLLDVTGLIEFPQDIRGMEYVSAGL